MTAPPCAGCGGVLTIDGVDLSAGLAFRTPSLLQLWGTDFDVRGTDRLVPMRIGVLPYRRRVTVTQQAVRLLISGMDTWDGSPHVSIITTLEANVTYLRDHLVSPPGTPTGTRWATLLMPSGTVLSGEVHVLRLATGVQAAGNWLAATLDISIPGGRLT